VARLDEDRIRQLFEKSGALLTGHFLLSSGLHSGQYLEKFRLVENPEALEPMCAELAERFREAGPQIVLGPTTAGIILAYNIARHLGVMARFAEPASSGRALRRGQTLPPHSRVLVVDDILTTGLSVRECLDVVKEHGAEVVGVGVLADRSGGKADPGVRLEALWHADIPAYRPEECPLCRQGVPLTKPGSRAGIG